MWVLTNILSFSTDTLALFEFYILVRSTIAKEAKCSKNDLFDNVTVQFEHLKEIMQRIFKDKFPQKIHLLKDLAKSQKASSLLNLIIVDWLVNNSLTDNRLKKKMVSSKSTPKVQIIMSQPDKNKSHKMTPSNTSRTLAMTGINQDLSRTLPVSFKNQEQSFDGKEKIKEALNRLNHEKLYLLRAQEQTDLKITKFKMANSDLVKEYNLLHEKTRKLYDVFFEVFYAIKLNSKTKFAKLGFSEDDLNRVKEFKQFQKLTLTDNSTSEDNPMVNIIRSKSSKIILHSTVQSSSKIAKSNYNIDVSAKFA